MNIFIAFSMRDYDNNKHINKINNFAKSLYAIDSSIIMAHDINKTIKESDRYKSFEYIEKKYFFPIIYNSDVVIGSSNSKSNQFTIGVIIELEHAIFNNKVVYEYDYLNNNVTLFEYKDIGKHYKDIVYTIPGEESTRIMEIYGEDIKQGWWKYKTVD